MGLPGLIIPSNKHWQSQWHPKPPVSPSRFGNVPNQFFENKLRDLNIVAPLSSAPAYAGTGTDGRKVFVRVRYGQNVPGLGPGSFVLLVDGVPLPSTDTVLATKIESEYWLLVNLPP